MPHILDNSISFVKVINTTIKDYKMSVLQEIIIEYISYTNSYYQEINTLCESQYYNTIAYECAIRNDQIKKLLESIYQSFLKYQETACQAKTIEKCLDIFLEELSLQHLVMSLSRYGFYPYAIYYYLSKRLKIASKITSSYTHRDLISCTNKKKDGEFIEILELKSNGELHLFNVLNGSSPEKILPEELIYDPIYEIIVKGERPSLQIQHDNNDYIAYNKTHTINSIIQQIKTVHNNYQKKLTFELPAKNSCALMFFIYDRLTAVKKYNKTLSNQYIIEKKKICTSENTSNLYELTIDYNDLKINIRDAKAHIIEDLSEINIKITIHKLQRLLTKANKLIKEENYKQVI